MSEPKFTPGPWSVGPTHRESEGKTWLSFSYQTHIVAPNGLTDLAIVEVGEDEGVANARLIAAAPELYAAACEAFGALVGSHAADDSVQGRARARLRAAIRLAEGTDG